jgi:hypothetical protein
MPKYHFAHFHPSHAKWTNVRQLLLRFLTRFVSKVRKIFWTLPFGHGQISYHFIFFMNKIFCYAWISQLPRPNHRHLRKIDWLMAHTVFLACLISTVSGRSKKCKKCLGRCGATSRHITELEQSIFLEWSHFMWSSLGLTGPYSRMLGNGVSVNMEQEHYVKISGKYFVWKHTCSIWEFLNKKKRRKQVLNCVLFIDVDDKTTDYVTNFYFCTDYSSVF